MVAHADIPLSLILFENSRMNFPSLGSHMGLPLPEPSQNRCCLWNQNSTIIHGIKPLRRLTPPPHPFRGGKYFINFAINSFSPERLFPCQGKCLRQQTKGCPFPEEKMSALLTEGFNRHTSGHGNPHQGGWVRRSRTFSVP